MSSKRIKLASELENDESKQKIEPNPVVLADDTVNASQKEAGTCSSLHKTKAKQEETKAEPIPGRCQFYLQRKKRYCKTIPPTCKNYCVEHSHLLGESSQRKRIPCPLDPKHTCYEDQLKKHLKKCNAREDIQPVFYVKNINSGEEEGADPGEYKVGIRQISDEEVLRFVDKVRQLHKEHVPQLKEDILFHDVLRSAAENPKNGSSALKHIKQQASLVGHLEKLALLTNGTTFIEFGAGKGGLSHWVQLAARDCADTKYLLIDRSSVRYKMDSYHRGEEQGPSFERIKIDIEHFHLGKNPSVMSGDGHIVSIGKHLCGAATDLMLRCLIDTLPTDNMKDGTRSLGGVVLALCCHHRCEWKPYVGKQFMSEIGVSARDFHLLVSMSSWATCGTRPTKTESASPSDEEEHGEVDPTAAKEYSHPRYGSLTPEDRELLGYQCKQLIDTGRLRYMEHNGLDTELIYFIDKSYSLENMALIAKHKTDKSS